MLFIGTTHTMMSVGLTGFWLCESLGSLLPFSRWITESLTFNTSVNVGDVDLDKCDLMIPCIYQLTSHMFSLLAVIFPFWFFFSFKRTFLP